MINILSFAMYRSMSFELKCAVNSVALKLMLEQFISYSLPAVLACQHGGVNRMGHVTAGALFTTSTSTQNLHTAPLTVTPPPPPLFENRLENALFKVKPL